MSLPLSIHCSALSALLLLPVAGMAQIDDFELQGWTRVFTDEFEGTEVDPAVWDVLNRRDSFNYEKQYYLDEQVTVVNGKARLTATDEPIDGKAYRSGLIRTWQEWSYGRFEVRADLPSTQGMWPAIWLLPRTADWPTGGEIDIMENRGSQPNLVSSAYHFQTNPNTPCCSEHEFVYDEYTAPAPGGGLVDFHAGMHDYAVEWEPESIRFYVDGVRHYEVTENDATLFGTAKSLIINLAVGGFFGGDPDATTVFPQHFDVEYVRAWQRENGFFGVVNGGYDEDGGSLNDWGTFGQTATSLTVHGGESFTGDASLRLAAEPGGAGEVGAFQGVKVDGGETLRARAETLVPAGEAMEPGAASYVKVEFYSVFGGQYGSAQFLGEESLLVANSGAATGQWSHNDWLVDVPAGAVEARMTAILSEGGAASGATLFDAMSLVEVAPLSGDYNFDGLVDAADYTVWRDTLGSTNDLRADGDRNGVVEQADLAAWQSAYGDAAAFSAAVPEPSGLALLALGGLFSRRR